MPADLPCQDAVVEDVVALLRRRSAVGQAKYGCDLTGLSLRAALQHLLEEQLDAANYTMAAIRRLDATQVQHHQLGSRDGWGYDPLGCGGWGDKG